MKKKLLFHIVFVLCFSASSAFADSAVSAGEIIKSLKFERLRGFAGMETVDEKPSISLKINFKIDSAVLEPDAIPQLIELGKALECEELQGWIYKIEGHTCDLGTDEHNMTLSQQRALTVFNYLTSSFKLSPKQFQTEGFGETMPLVAKKNENARKQNRRVVIKNTLVPFSIEGAELNEMKVQIKALRNNCESIIRPGQALISSEQYAVEFLSSKYSHVYIYQADSSGKTTCLFPNFKISSYNNPIQSGQLYKIPEYGQRFVLDNTAGRETFIIIGYNAPLTESQQMDIIEKNRGMGEIVDDRPHVSDSNIFVRSVSFIHK